MAEMRVVTCFLLVVALFADVSQQQPNTCRGDWVRLGGSCYRFGREPLTWSVASWMCRENGGYLAEINSLEENNVVVAQIRTIQENSNNHGSSYWIGASDMFTEGHWLWQSNDRIIGQYTNWAPGQPDNAGGIEHCMEIRTAFDYKWNDYQCSFKNLFVCESSPLCECSNHVGRCVV